MTTSPRKRRNHARIRITDEQRSNEKPNLNRHWRAEFLAGLAETSNVTASAAAAGIDPARAYKVRRKEPAFRALWYAALLEGYEHLELETLERLRTGATADSIRFDIPNALRLLAAHRESVVRERALREDQDEDAIIASLDAKIAAMRQREEEAARILNAAGNADAA